MPHHLKPLLNECEIIQMVNQIEIHPGMLQSETVKASQNQGMQIEAWSPLGTGRMLKNETLMQIASKYLAFNFCKKVSFKACFCFF